MRPATLTLNQGSDAAAIAYIEIAGDFIQGSLHGVGIHSNIVTASLLAILSAVNRALQQVDTTTQERLLGHIEQGGEIAIAN